MTCSTGKAAATETCSPDGLVFLSKTMRESLNFWSLSTLTLKDSSDLLTLLVSTAIPIVLAYLACKPTAFNSAGVKPLPALTLLLCLIVGHLTTGLKRSTGFGATFAAFAALADLLEAFLPAWSRWTLTLSCQCFLKWFLRIGRFLWIAVIW
jgi:hypothetical protein